MFNWSQANTQASSFFNVILIFLLGSEYTGSSLAWTIFRCGTQVSLQCERYADAVHRFLLECSRWLMVNRGERSGESSKAWVECINPVRGSLMWWREKENAGWKISKTQLHHLDAWITVCLQILYSFWAKLINRMHSAFLLHSMSGSMSSFSSISLCETRWWFARCWNVLL